MKRVLAYAAAAAAFGGSALAQDEVLEDGVYFRLAAGVTFANEFEQDFNYNPDLAFVISPPSMRSIDTEKGLAAAAALGFDYADGIRTELEFRFANTDRESIALDGVATAADDKVSAKFLMANFFFDFDNETAFTPFIGGGVGGAVIGDGEGNKDAALAYQGRAGVSLDLGDGAAISAEYVYLRTNDLVYGPNIDDFTPAGPFEPNLTGRYESSSVMLSVRKRF